MTAEERAQLNRRTLELLGVTGGDAEARARIRASSAADDTVGMKRLT